MRFNSVETKKSRTINFDSYYEFIQLEYIVSELRYNLYPENDHRKLKSKEIMEFKKEKIKNIAITNDRKCIIDFSMGSTSYFDISLKRKLYSLIYPENRIPNFIYRDETHRDKLEKIDKRYYYKYGDLFTTPKGIGELIKLKEDTALVRIPSIGICEFNSFDIFRELKFLKNIL